jgi:hypothetical protein
MTYRIIQGSGQSVGFAAAGGASAQSAAFGSQTRVIRVSVTGIYSATAGVRIEVGDNPTATTTSPLLVVNHPEYFIVTPGQKIAVLGNDTVIGNVSVAECTA